MSIYSEAYDAQDCQILGNLDGQWSFGASTSFRRTAFYRNLKSGAFRGSPRVAYWLIVDSTTGKTLEHITRSANPAPSIHHSL